MASTAAQEPAAFRPRAEAGAVPAFRLRCVSWSSLDRPERRMAWQALAECASEPNPFFESWFLLPALRAHDPGGSVKILALEVDGVLAGLMPLRHEERYYGWPIPQLTTWIHGNCFLGVPLVARGLEREWWRYLLGWADSNPKTSLFLHLPQVPLGGPLREALQAELETQRRRGAVVFEEHRAMLAAEGSSRDYFEQSMSGKKRKELRRQFNRLAELGEIEFTRRTDAQELDCWVRQFLDLEHSGWKGMQGTALASHESTASMFREALQGAAQAGRLERLTLTLDGAPLAMLASFQTPPGSFSFKTAFDERYSRYSPGVLLQLENLAMLDRGEVDWCDSCAAADHMMIDHIWRERRQIGHLSIAIGGPVRKAVFNALVGAELRRKQARTR